MEPGKMRHRITFQRLSGKADISGQPLDKWRKAVTVWAAVDPISGKEFYAAGQSQSEVTHKVRIRYCAGLSTAMRIVFGKRRFHIVSIINWGERNEGILLMCRELVM